MGLPPRMCPPRRAVAGWPVASAVAGTHLCWGAARGPAEHAQDGRAGGVHRPLALGRRLLAGSLHHHNQDRSPWPWGSVHCWQRPPRPGTQCRAGTWWWAGSRRCCGSAPPPHRPAPRCHLQVPMPHRRALAHSSGPEMEPAGVVPRMLGRRSSAQSLMLCHWPAPLPSTWLLLQTQRSRLAPEQWHGAAPPSRQPASSPRFPESPQPGAGRFYLEHRSSLFPRYKLSLIFQNPARL